MINTTDNTCILIGNLATGIVEYCVTSVVSFLNYEFLCNFDFHIIFKIAYLFSNGVSLSKTV